MQNGMTGPEVVEDTEVLDSSDMNLPVEDWIHFDDHTHQASKIVNTMSVGSSSSTSYTSEEESTPPLSLPTELNFSYFPFGSLNDNDNNNNDEGRLPPQARNQHNDSQVEVPLETLFLPAPNECGYVPSASLCLGVELLNMCMHAKVPLDFYERVLRLFKNHSFLHVDDNHKTKSIPTT